MNSGTDHKQLKPAYMRDLRQFQFEKDTLKRSLTNMMEENVRLKMRLSEVLKDPFDINLLEELEIFQSEFIKEDELIGLMRNETVELEKLLNNEIIRDEITVSNIVKKIKKLQGNIMSAETHFDKLKSTFHNYLLENI